MISIRTVDGCCTQKENSCPDWSLFIGTHWEWRTNLGSCFFSVEDFLQLSLILWSCGQLSLNPVLGCLLSSFGSFRSVTGSWDWRRKKVLLCAPDEGRRSCFVYCYWLPFEILSIAYPFHGLSLYPFLCLERTLRPENTITIFTYQMTICQPKRCFVCVSESVSSQTQVFVVLPSQCFRPRCCQAKILKLFCKPPVVCSYVWICKPLANVWICKSLRNCSYDHFFMRWVHGRDRSEDLNLWKWVLSRWKTKSDRHL